MARGLAQRRNPTRKREPLAGDGSKLPGGNLESPVSTSSLVAQKIHPIDTPSPGTEVQVPTPRNVGIKGHLPVRATTEQEVSDIIILDAETEEKYPDCDHSRENPSTEKQPCTVRPDKQILQTNENLPVDTVDSRKDQQSFLAPGRASEETWRRSF